MQWHLVVLIVAVYFVSAAHSASHKTVAANKERIERIRYLESQVASLTQGLTEASERERTLRKKVLELEEALGRTEDDVHKAREANEQEHRERHACIKERDNLHRELSHHKNLLSACRVHENSCKVDLQQCAEHRDAIKVQVQELGRSNDILESKLASCNAEAIALQRMKDDHAKEVAQRESPGAQRKVVIEELEKAYGVADPFAPEVDPHPAVGSAADIAEMFAVQVAYEQERQRRSHIAKERVVTAQLERDRVVLEQREAAEQSSHNDASATTVDAESEHFL